MPGCPATSEQATNTAMEQQRHGRHVHCSAATMHPGLIIFEDDDDDGRAVLWRLPGTTQQCRCLYTPVVECRCTTMTRFCTGTKLSCHALQPEVILPECHSTSQASILVSRQCCREVMSRQKGAAIAAPLIDLQVNRQTFTLNSKQSIIIMTHHPWQPRDTR